MDFENVLSIASQNQGLSSVNLKKRYSLQAGPPKKDPKVKGVNSAAVQAFLKKKEMEDKKKELVHKKQKEELLAKRVELKSDRKARAMASRTKDNFKGYNGIPVVEQPKKRGMKAEASEDPTGNVAFEEGDEDNLEYSQSDSEPEPEPVMVPSRPPSKPFQKPPATAKSAPPPMNFADLLKLAQKKQYEPVELKPVKKSEERLRTAEELRELELERRARRQDRGGDVRQERGGDVRQDRGGDVRQDRGGDARRDRGGDTKQDRGGDAKRERGGDARQERGGDARQDRRPQANSSFSKRSAVIPTTDKMSQKPHKSSLEKPPQGGTSKKPKSFTPGEREWVNGSSKPSCPVGPKPTSGSSGPSGALCSKAAVKTSSMATAKMPLPRPALSQRPSSSTSSDLSHRKGNPSLLPPGKSAGSGTRPSSSSHSSMPARPPSTAQAKHSSSASGRPGSSATLQPGKGEPARPGKGLSASAKPSSNGQSRPAPSGPPRPTGHPQPRPGGNFQSGVRPMAQGPGRPGDSSVQGRPISSLSSGPGRPKCTVVSETISSKNFAPKPGMGPRIPPGYRPTMRPPGPPLPPITSSYKRKYEEENDEYDSEMEDFIDDEGQDQSEVSKHIREIFGYDRTKYKEESDYALKFMESSWRDQQKEEARSLKMAVLEDLEEEKREEEELKRQNAKRRKNR